MHPVVNVVVVVVVNAVVGLDIHDTRCVSTSSAWQMDRHCSFMWHCSSRCGGDDNQHGSFPTDCGGGWGRAHGGALLVVVFVDGKKIRKKEPGYSCQNFSIGQFHNDSDDGD